MTPPNQSVTPCICGNPDCEIPYGHCHCGCGKLCKISPQDATQYGHKRGEPRIYLLGHWNSVPPPIEDAQPFKLEDVYCRLIPISRGMYTIVDAADYERMMQWKWTAKWDQKGRRFYVVKHGLWVNGKRTTVYMARHILGLDGNRNLEGDHKDRMNTLDNRRKNLRPGTHAQNSQNSSHPCGKTSKYKGVSFHKLTSKWIAQISVDRKKKHLGLFDTEELAYAAYCSASLKYHGEFSRLE